MKVTIPRCVFVAAWVAAVAPVFAQQNQKPDVLPRNPTKEQIHARMQSLAQEIQKLKNSYATPSQIDAALQELNALSKSLGGDLPAAQPNGSQSFAPVSTSGTQLLVPSACGSTITTTLFPGTTGPILPLPPAGNVFTAVVAGAGTYLWDLDLTTGITHTGCADIDMTLTSPAGTTVVITTDNGGTLDNVFNGTLWDEQTLLATRTCADRNVEAPLYVNLVTMTPLVAEGRMEAFRGEDPNGVWTLTVADDLATNVGNVNSWSIDVSTIPAPVTTTTNTTQSPGLPILDVATVFNVMPVAVGGTYLSTVTLYTEILHTFAADLDITLTSPAGTVVKITTDNGGGNDNVFNGTLWSGDASIPITDAVTTNLVAFPLAGPEGALENFRGENPNGPWTLTITDDLGGDVGTLVRWDLNITTIPVPVIAAPLNFPGTIGPINDPPVAPPPVPTIYTAAVGGVGTYLWDVDLSTLITHTAGADLDMTLTSPAGTTVTISTDNGGVNDNVFNGTLWDDNANDPATDHVYLNNVTATPLSPEGRLDAFRGQDPNGLWTLTITDDATGTDYGSTNGWSLNVSTLTGPPADVTTITSQSPVLAIGAGPPPISVSDTMLLGGLGTSITEIELYLEVTHTFNADLNITLTSPSGTAVRVSTLNGGSFDNVFNGTLFDGSVTDTVTDHLYMNLLTATPLSPEGSFGAFIGQDPNGLWTLTIDDTANLDGGSFNRWDLIVRTCLGNGAAFCSNSTLAPAPGFDHVTPCPCGNVGAGPNGCAHSFSAAGANITANGSIALDTVQLFSSGEPATSFTLFMQHDAAGDGVFHDGVLCAGGTLIRLRGRAAGIPPLNPGEATFPNPAFDASITLSQRGSVVIGSGSTRYYAAWFRNASTSFCPPATANVTNGWVITW